MKGQILSYTFTDNKLSYNLIKNSGRENIVSNEVLIQWGYSNGGQTTTFPISFSNRRYAVVATVEDDAWHGYGCNFQRISNSQLSFKASGAWGICWLTLGC